MIDRYSVAVWEIGNGGVRRCHGNPNGARRADERIDAENPGHYRQRRRHSWLLRPAPLHPRDRHAPNPGTPLSLSLPHTHTQLGDDNWG